MSREQLSEVRTISKPSLNSKGLPIIGTLTSGSCSCSGTCGGCTCCSCQFTPKEAIAPIKGVLNTGKKS